MYVIHRVAVTMGMGRGEAELFEIILCASQIRLSLHRRYGFFPDLHVLWKAMELTNKTFSKAV